MKRIAEWRRLHRIEPPVVLRVVASPVTEGDWLVRTDGWDLPAHTPVLYESLEAVQRAADDVLINYHLHNCQRQGCDEWLLMEGHAHDTPARPI